MFSICRNERSGSILLSSRRCALISLRTQEFEWEIFIRRIYYFWKNETSSRCIVKIEHRQSLMLKNLEILRISLISADYKSIFAFAHFQWFVMLLSTPPANPARGNVPARLPGGRTRLRLIPATNRLSIFTFARRHFVDPQKSCSRSLFDR